MKPRLKIGYFVTFAVIFAMLQYPSHARADTPWIELHVASKHTSSGYKVADATNPRGYKDVAYNEKNTGIALMFTIKKNVEAGFGVFKNSYNIQTKYAAIDFHTTPKYGVRYGVTLGIMKGYEYTPTPSNVLALPNVTFTAGKHFRVKVGVLPTRNSPVTLTLGVRF